MIGLIFLCLSSTVIFADNIKDAETYKKQGNAKYEKQDYVGAIKDYTIAIKLNPKYADAYHNRGSAKIGLNDYAGAIDDYTKAIKLDPKNAKAYYGRGLAEADFQDYVGAIKDYTIAIELNPKYVEAYNNRGVAKYNLGDKKGALEDSTEAAKLGSPLATKNIKEFHNLEVSNKSKINSSKKQAPKSRQVTSVAQAYVGHWYRRFEGDDGTMFNEDMYVSSSTIKTYFSGAPDPLSRSYEITSVGEDSIDITETFLESGWEVNRTIQFSADKRQITVITHTIGGAETSANYIYKGE